MSAEYSVEEVLSAMDEAAYALEFLPGHDGIAAKIRLQKARATIALHPHSPDAADSGRVGDGLLSSRLRPQIECSPWVIEEVRKLESALAAQGQGELKSLGMASCGKPLCSENDHHPLCLTQMPAPPASPAGVPDGWVLVPRDPTPAMIVAFWEPDMELGRDGYMRPVEIYKAMLAAAPSAPEGGEVGL